MIWVDRKIKPEFQIILDTYRDHTYKAAMKHPEIRGHDEDPEDKWIGLEYLKDYLQADPGKGGPRYFRLYQAKNSEKKDPDTLHESVAIDDICRMKLGGTHWGSGAAQYYPPGGYMSWHDNHNAPGWNILFTWSEKGDGFFRWYDLETGKIETMLDRPGWSAKIGYYGGTDEDHGINDPTGIVPHCCKNYDHRFTFGWLTFAKEFQDDMLESGEIFE